MTIADWLMIASVLIGPLIAVQLTRHLDNKREIRGRKLQIFKTLMATRAYNISWDHVEALNRIDLEFDKDDAKEKAVLNSWKEYLDLLGNTAMPIDQWGIRRVDLLVELLHKMAIVLDYDFDKTHIKNSSYSPRAHGEIEDQQSKIRKLTIELLEGERAIPVHLGQQPTNENTIHSIQSDRAR